MLTLEPFSPQEPQRVCQEFSIENSYAELWFRERCFVWSYSRLSFRRFVLALAEGERASSGTNYVRVAAGATHSCAFTSGNKIVCWGDSSKNQTEAPNFGYCLKLADGPVWTFNW